MNTREEIINFLSKSDKPLSPKEISLELKKTSANIRKILSNLYKEGKIKRVGFGKYKPSVNVKPVTVNVLRETVNIKEEEAILAQKGSAPGGQLKKNLKEGVINRLCRDTNVLILNARWYFVARQSGISININVLFAGVNSGKYLIIKNLEK